MTVLVDNARYFAILAHEGQVRKYTKEPYWHHCRDVARMVKERTDNDIWVAAAWLHDTIEDTDATAEVIWDKFPECYQLVCALTDHYTPENYSWMKREERKWHEANRIGELSRIIPGLREIKLCDLIDNTRSIVEHDPKFAITYLREKANLLEAMGFGK